MKEYLSKSIYIIVFAVSILALSFLADQHDFKSIFSFYLIAFFSYFLIGIDNQSTQKLINRTFWLKIILVFAFPLASDDIFRFYWDGMLCTQGFSPYKYLPSEILSMNSIHFDPAVYQKLNSKEYYSVYPPMLQFLFSICYFISFKSVYIFSVIWKLILVLVDAGSIYLLKKLSVSSKLIYWYALNPLILFEVFANGHPEGLLLFFLIGLLWAIQQNNLNLKFIFLACATAVKIFPIVFFPLFLKKIHLKKIIKLFLLTTVLLLVFFLPIYPYQDHFMESINLYFKKFEFNGSLFEIWKWIDYNRFGYDNIAGISRFLSLSFLMVLIAGILHFLMSDKSSILRSVFWIWLFYLLLATTVHPWYILPVFLISLFASNLIGLVWSLLIVLSYCWYDTDSKDNKVLFLIVEYSLLILVIIFDLHVKSARIKKLLFS